MGTLTEYVTKMVKRQSVVVNNKKQTPSVIPSQTLQDKWQTMKLKKIILFTKQIQNNENDEIIYNVAGTFVVSQWYGTKQCFE